MVRIVPAQVIDVQRHLGMIDEALEEFVNKIDIEFTDTRPRELDIEFQSGAAGKIEHDPGKGLVQRYIGMAVAAYALLVADRLGECLAQRDADVLDRVMSIDMQVALGGDADIHHAMPRDLIQHVIEETESAVQFGNAGAIKIDGSDNLGFKGITFDFCDAHGDILLRPMAQQLIE